MLLLLVKMNQYLINNTSKVNQNLDENSPIYNIEEELEGTESLTKGCIGGNKVLDTVGEYIGFPGEISKSEEFCNTVLFIAFSLILIYALDAFVRFIIVKSKI